MRTARVVFALLLLAAPIHAQQSDNPAFWADSIRRSIDEAVITGEIQGLVQARALAERALTRFPDDAVLLHYLGFSLYREANLRTGREESGDVIEKLLERAEEVFEWSAAKRAMPETHALLASVIGQRIGSNPLRGMTMGPRSESMMERAMRDGPTNPRVWLLNGISAIFKPSMFGGGLDNAESHLKKAVELFERDRPVAPLPAWGKDEAYIWLGQVYQRRKMTDRAREMYNKALSIQPRNGWVRDVLLPGLDKG
jgi:tetratricopeptide (TPR) repeat protein